MAYFTQEFLRFFMDLAPNNNKEWFDANRKRYEQHAREPFKAFTADLIHALKPHMNISSLEAKDCIFRINRDIRFSKDKTPYKLHMSAAIAPGGKKDMENPGLYVQLDPENTRIYSGSYMPSKERLYAIREKIAKDPGKLDQLLKAPGFKKFFGTIHGEQNKVLPKEFKDAAAVQPLIYNKGFYYFNKLEPEVCLQEDFIDLIVEHYQAAKPMNDFLTV